MLKNKKGFTLVEIIISLAIFSIVSLVLGSVLVSGFDQFFQISNANNSKLIGDQIISYMRQELVYATDIRIQSELPDTTGDWYSFTIKDGRLYQYHETNHEDLSIYNDEFYQSQDLTLMVHVVDQEPRLDLQASLLVRDELQYSGSDSLQLLNMTESPSITISSGQWQEIDEPLKIYYKKDKLVLKEDTTPVEPEVPEEPGDNEDSVTITGTVEDQLALLSPANNRGEGNLNNGFTFRQYDMIFYDGYWWMFITDGTNIALPYQQQIWKCLRKTYHEKSAYEKGDIVEYNGRYYRSLMTQIYYVPAPSEWTKDRWEEVTDFNDQVPNIPEGLEESVEQALVYRKQTIVKKLDGLDLTKVKDYDVSLADNVAVAVDPSHPTVDEIYKIVTEGIDAYGNKTGQSLTRYFIKVLDNGAKVDEAIDGQVGWQEIKVDYDSNSAYVQGDMIVLDGNGISYAMAKQTVDISMTHQEVTNDCYDGPYWQSVTTR